MSSALIIIEYLFYMCNWFQNAPKSYEIYKFSLRRSLNLNPDTQLHTLKQINEEKVAKFIWPTNTKKFRNTFFSS
jgi:hypothetical protein